MNESDYHPPAPSQEQPADRSRRDFLKKSALSTLALGSGAFMGTAANGQPRTTTEAITNPGEAKNVIFLVSDGMSAGTLTMADLMLRRHHDRTSHWARLYEAYDEHPVRRGLMDMASRNSMVTGSGAASTSWGTGYRVNNGAVGVGPDGEEYQTILEVFRDAGKSTGLVTTTRITHATPAGFGTNVPERGMEDEIAEQYLDREYDVLRGGGSRHYDPDSRDDGRDLFAEHEDAGYEVVRTKDELAARDASGKILGTFYDTHVPYTTDHLHIDEYRETVPTLEEMTDAALQRLDQNQDGFILQIEGGRVDHAAHGNDTAGLVYDQIAFDDAIGRVLEFVEGRDDTLVLVTTDHGNANPGVNGIGSGYGDSNPMFDAVADFERTNTWILSELDEDSTYREIKDRIERAWQLQITRNEAFTLQQALRGDFEAVYRARSRPSAVLSAIQANYTAVNWIGSMHTSDYVELAALGPGSEAIGAFTRNTDLFDVMVEAAGVADYATG